MTQEEQRLRAGVIFVYLEHFHQVDKTHPGM